MPLLSYFKIWGCEAYVKRLLTEKLEPRSDKCLFVGYPQETRGYYFYLPSENKVFVARRGHFLEKKFLDHQASGSKIDLEEVREPQSEQVDLEQNSELPLDGEQSGYVFMLHGGAVVWKNSKQKTVPDSTTEAEYIEASEAAKEAVWLR